MRLNHFAYGLIAGCSIAPVALGKEVKGVDAGKTYIFTPGQPNTRPTMVDPAPESKSTVPQAPLVSVPPKGKAQSRPVILDKATPKD